MLIEQKGNMFFGYKESISDTVDQLSAILSKHNDPHTIISCLAVMGNMSRLDLIETLNMCVDVGGIESIVHEGLSQGLSNSQEYIEAAKECIV